MHVVARFCAKNTKPCGTRVEDHAADIASNNGKLPLLDAFDRSIFVGDIMHLECSICLNVPQDIVETPCGHVFCNNCIRKVFAATRNYESMSVTTSVVCPTCRADFEVRQLLFSKFMERHIANLTVKCADCGWSGSQRNYASHLRSFSNYECPLCFECIPDMTGGENSTAQIVAVRKHIDRNVKLHLTAFVDLLFEEFEEKSDDTVECSASSSDALDD